MSLKHIIYFGNSIDSRGLDKHIEQNGYSLTNVDSIKSVIEKLKLEDEIKKYNLLLINCNFAQKSCNIDPIQLIEDVRNYSTAKDIAIVGFEFSAHEKILGRWYEAGGDSFITNPNQSGLIARINRFYGMKLVPR